MRPRHLLFTTLLIGALLLSGCGNQPSPSQGAAQPTPASGAPSDSAATPAAQPTPAADQPTQAPVNNTEQTTPVAPPPTADTPSAPVTGGGATIPLLQSQTNLAQLESYRMTVVWTTNGKTADGQTVDSKTTYAQATHRPSKTGYTLVVEEQRGASPARSEVYSVGDTLYVHESQGGIEICQPAMVTGVGDMFRGAAEAMTSPLQTGFVQLVNRGETVNGVAADRYTLDQETINQFSASGATVEKADLWIARDGGYLVKYDLTIKVKSGASDWAAMSGGKPIAEGVIAYNLSLEDINKTTITLPSACSASATGANLPVSPDAQITLPGVPGTQVNPPASPGAPGTQVNPPASPGAPGTQVNPPASPGAPGTQVNLPLPPGTQVDVAVPGSTIGRVNASFNSVLTFFKTEYPKRGYELILESGDTQLGYTLEFQKGSEEVVVVLAAMPGGSVQITVTYS